MIRALGAFLLLLCAASLGAQAQPSAGQRVDVIVNVAPGRGRRRHRAASRRRGSAEALGQGVVVDNRGGGDGYVGIDAVVRAEAGRRHPRLRAGQLAS